MPLRLSPCTLMIVMHTMIVGAHNVMCWNVANQVRMFSITCAVKKKRLEKVHILLEK
jgi:hypothetical protein